MDKKLTFKKYSQSLQNLPFVVPFEKGKTKYHILNLSDDNPRIQNLNLQKTSDLQIFVDQELDLHHAEMGIGGYAEKRSIYQRSAIFRNAEMARNIHLGWDIWLPALTSVFTPLPAHIHSFQDNDNDGDYGPTLILKHALGNLTFYTLYGHLSRASMRDWEEGKTYEAGSKVAELGEEAENGNWAPHLHFQVILEMWGNVGDFSGVALETEKEKYLKNCPDPNELFQDWELNF